MLVAGLNLKLHIDVLHITRPATHDWRFEQTQHCALSTEEEFPQDFFSNSEALDSEYKIPY